MIKMVAMAKQPMESKPTQATDFVYTFHLSSSGEICHESTAGAFTEITGHPPDILQQRGWTGLIYPKDDSL